MFTPVRWPSASCMFHQRVPSCLEMMLWSFSPATANTDRAAKRRVRPPPPGNKDPTGRVIACVKCLFWAANLPACNFFPPSWLQQIRPHQQRKHWCSAGDFTLNKISCTLFLTPIAAPSAQTGPVNQQPHRAQRSPPDTHWWPSCLRIGNHILERGTGT